MASLFNGLVSLFDRGSTQMVSLLFSRSSSESKRFFGRGSSETVSEPPIEAPSPPPLASQPGFDTVFGANCTLEGKLASKGNIRLDGVFSGQLDISGNILIGESARIKADIHARNISIAGHVHGNVSGHKVQILRTGHVVGDISAMSITAEEGAYIDGKITMVRQDAPAEATPPATKDDTAAKPATDTAS